MQISMQKNIDKKSILKGVGIFSLSLAVASSAVFLYSPVIKTHADTDIESDVNLTVNPVVSLAVDKSSLEVGIVPNTFGATAVTTSTGTNSQFGYTLTIEDADANSNMTHIDSNVTDVLVSDFSGSKTSDEMETNTWGFSLNSTDYYKVPVNGSPASIKRTNERNSSNDELTEVRFGAKIGNVAYGVYSDSVVFTIYVNGVDGKPSNPDDPSNPPVEPTEPGEDPAEPEYDDTMMQGFDGDACAEMSVGDTATLIDARDNNEYSIAKLADNRCWMVENLRIVNRTITSADSNLPTGEVFQIPESNISSFQPQVNNTIATYVSPTLEYGTYYSYYTATAGWGDETVTSGIAPKDICPKGWRLPTGGDPEDEYYAGGSNETVTLYESYNNSPTAMINGLPNFGVFTGYVNPGYSWQPGTQSVEGAGEMGIYVTSTVRHSENFYSIISNYYKGTYYFGPSASNKYNGYPVRCILK